MASQIKAAQIKTTIVLAGKDRASREINKATGSLRKMEAQADKAKQRLSGLGGSIRSAMSGDALGAVKNMRSALGGIGGAGGTAMLAAGGIAAVGVAAAGAAVKLTQMLEGVERFRVQARAAFAGGEQEALRFANTIGGVSVQSVVDFRSQLAASGIDADFSAKQLQNLANTAARVGKTGDDALTAFAQAIRTGNARALSSVGVFINASRVQDDYAKSLGKTTTQLTQQEKQAALVAELQSRLSKDVEASNTVWSRQDAALARLGNQYEATKLAISESLSPALVTMVEALADVGDAIKSADFTIEDHNATLIEYQRAMSRGSEVAYRYADAQYESAKATKELIKQLEKVGRLRTIEGHTGTVEPGGISALRAAQKRAQRMRLGSRRAVARDRGAGKAKTPEDEQRDALQRSKQLSAEIDKLVKARESALKVEEDLGLVRAQLSGLADAAIEKMRIELELKRKLREIAGDPDEEKKAELARAEAKLALQQVEKRAADERLENEQKLAEAQQRAIELERQRRMATIDSTTSLLDAGAALAMSSAFLSKNDKLQRAILAGRSLADAARETALAAASGAAGNPIKAAAHGVAAAAHIAAAARFRGGGGGGGSSASGAGATVAATRDVARGGQRERGGNVTINLPPGTFVGNEAALAAELKRTMLAAAGTGL